MILKFLFLAFVNADWRENFKEFGDWVLRRAETLPAACQTMNDEFFPAFLADAKNQAYFCLAFEGKETDEVMNSAGEVFRALYCQDAADLGFDCSPDSSLILAKAVSVMPDRVMYGIEVSLGISTRRRPKFLHTKWNISHSDPEFDFTPRIEQARLTKDVACGKADLLRDAWVSDLGTQMASKEKSQNVHIAITWCDPRFLTDSPEKIFSRVGFTIYTSPDNEADALDLKYYYHWDRDNLRSRQVNSWKPFLYSQCCSTFVIAP